MLKEAQKKRFETACKTEPPRFYQILPERVKTFFLKISELFKRSVRVLQDSSMIKDPIRLPYLLKYSILWKACPME